MDEPKLGNVDSVPCIDHNDNHVGNDELCFIGYGEDDSSNPEKIDVPKKWKLNDEDISEFIANDSNWEKYENGAFIQKIVAKFFIGSELQGGEFSDKNSTLDSLRSIIHSFNRNRPDLWQWLEQSSVLMGSPDDADGIFSHGSHRDSNVSASSLGILSFSEMSSFSYDSTKIENRTNSKEKLDTTVLIGEIEELHHQNKRLNEERSRLAKQIAQTEDSNTQLVHDNEELMKKVQSLQNFLDRLKETEKDHDDARMALHRLEEVNQKLQNNLVKEERENRELCQELKDSNQSLLLNQSDLDNVRQQLLEMSDALRESELALCALKVQYEANVGKLREKTALLDEKENLLQSFVEVTESLKQQKQSLELQLARAEEEIASLQYAARRDSTHEHQSELAISTCSHSDTSISSGSTSLEPPCQSTPVPVAKASSLCVEMRDALVSDGSVPFCGKHIFPEALYGNSRSPISPLSTRKVSFSVVPVARKRRACLQCHFQRTAFSGQNEKRVKLVDRWTDNDVAIFDFDAIGDHLDPKREIICREVSGGGIRDVLGLLCRMKDILSRLNADAAAVIGRYSGNSVLSDPPNTVIANANTAGGSTEIPEENLGEHISAELKVLKDELSKTNAILSTLSRSQQFVLSMPSFLHEPHNIKEGRQQYQSDLLPTPERKRHSWMKERATSVSQKSTPLHRTRSLTRSCPNLHNQWHIATRGTQTEELQLQQQQATASPDLPRNRSASFVAAIRKGQTAIEETETEKESVNLCPPIASGDKTIAERKHHKHSHVRIASTDKDDRKENEDEIEDEDEAKQAARKRRRSFSSGNYGLAFDHEEDEDNRARRQIAAVHAVGKQSSASKAAAEQSKELKNKFLMPEMESSETESAKDSANGSMESETTEPPPSSEDQQALASNFFKKAFFLKPDQLSNKEIEENFCQLSLAFKTDKFTLGKRLELQKRQRDIAEQNVEEEIKKMKEVIVKVNQQNLDGTTRELLGDLQQRIDVVSLTTSRMSSRSEVYGAVQQEERTNHAFEIMVTYVEQLKRLYDKEHHELEETRRLLLENRLLQEPSGGDIFLDDTKRTLRSMSTTGKPGARRRASIAVFRPLTQDRGKSPVTCTLHTGALVELRTRYISPSLTSVNKEETLGTISISSDPKLETGSTQSIRFIEDCATPLELLEGTREPEVGVETVASLESIDASSSDIDAREGDETEEMCANEESSPSCNNKTNAETSKTYFWQKAVNGSRQVLNLLPEDFPWDIVSVFRVLRYGLGTLLVFAAIVSLVSTFLPGKTSACAGRPSTSFFSIEEFLDNVFRHHVSFRDKHKPV